MATSIRPKRFVNLSFEVIDPEIVISYKLDSIFALAENIPAIVTVQDFKTWANIYINEYGCNFLERSKSELLEMGKKYYSKFFPSEEREQIKWQLRTITTDKSTSFFQRIRPNESSEYVWFFTTSQIYVITQKTERYLLNISFLVNKCSYMGQKLDNLVAENLFLQEHNQDLNHLSDREKEIFELIAQGHSSLQISKLLCISIHTVNNHRKNIIQKIGKKNLSAFLKINSIFPSNNI
ncbi:response regulator transcription factor [Aequorivita capsosiphonis]|uniref:response regulator transcription factor n=1 Tax=Aequorivita capsosiphonis TaxID=487317 RepID=UPI0004119572|nr:helix-turn-helix transcriptional regulator [Aequorivita capsosiphonis]